MHLFVKRSIICTAWFVCRPENDVTNVGLISWQGIRARKLIEEDEKDFHNQNIISHNIYYVKFYYTVLNILKSVF